MSKTVQKNKYNYQKLGSAEGEGAGARPPKYAPGHNASDNTSVFRFQCNSWCISSGSFDRLLAGGGFKRGSLDIG